MNQRGAGKRKQDGAHDNDANNRIDKGDVCPLGRNSHIAVGHSHHNKHAPDGHYLHDGTGLHIVRSVEYPHNDFMEKNDEGDNRRIHERQLADKSQEEAFHLRDVVLILCQYRQHDSAGYRVEDHHKLQYQFFCQVVYSQLACSEEDADNQNVEFCRYVIQYLCPHLIDAHTDEAGCAFQVNPLELDPVFGLSLCKVPYVDNQGVEQYRNHHAVDPVSGICQYDGKHKRRGCGNNVTDGNDLEKQVLLQYGIIQLPDAQKRQLQQDNGNQYG